MDAIIREKLSEIEQSERVRIILAVEAGSRAWGFASPDSDYDVRFIYIREKKEYLRLEEIRDSIDWQRDEHLDMEGWDLRKALRMIYRSAPEIYEWFFSQTIYRETPEAADLRKLLPEYFSLIKCAQNYLHIASMNFRMYFREEEVWLVKYFYLLRPMLQIKWMLEEKSIPPVQMEELVREKMPEEWKELILEILEKKKTTSELGKTPRNKRLNQDLGDILKEMDEQIMSMKEEKKKSWDLLDQYFYDVL